jgi:intergrase/recombinase
MKQHLDYDRNVFINCPFDEEYEKIFNAILFTVHKCGFILRCSKEYEDSSSVRIQNIIKLIRESKYSIHDLSRVTLDETAKLPRFNMPLELGICIGAIEYGTKKQKQNKYLIIESEKFRFKQFISDLSGQDIREHKNSVEGVIKIIRNWLSSKTTEKIPSASIILKEYESFQTDLPLMCIENQWIPNELTFDEYSNLVTSWLTLE